MRAKTIFTTGLLNLISQKITPDEIRMMEYHNMPECARQVICAFSDLHRAHERAREHGKTHLGKIAEPVIDINALQNEIKGKVFDNQQAAVAAAMADDGDEKFDRTRSFLTHDLYHTTIRKA